MNSFVDKLLCRKHDEESSGDEIHDRDAVNLSHVGDAVHRALGRHHNRHHLSQWNVTSGKVVGSVHDTPRDVVDSAEDPGSGNDDWFPDKLAEIIGGTETWCDIMSLGPPDGKFLTAFQKALGTLAERSKTSENPIIVRMLFGNIVGMPVNCNGVINALTKNLPGVDSSVKLHLWVGAWRKGFSWNHAKLIAVDGVHLHTGGHNLWDAHYLSNNPVHDLSIELQGEVARDGHRFANQQWRFVEAKQSTCVGCVVDSMPDYLPMALRTRVTVSEWPKGEVPVFPPQFTKSRAPRTQRLSLSSHVPDPKDVPLVSIGRQGTMVYRSRPSDDAILAMINSSKKIIRLVLQDLGPVCLPGTKKALPGLVWPKDYLAAIGRAIYERGVDVEMILSNPNSIPGGLKGTEANYGNGWDCVDVAAEIIKSIQKHHSNVDDAKLRAMVTDNLRICFVRHGKSSQYADGKTIGMHSKHFIVDDICCYIGSQNLYMCDLAEWGVMIDHEDEVRKIMDHYFLPVWKNSYTGEDVDVEMVMDGLNVDRDGEQPGMFTHGKAQGAEHMMPHGAGAEYYDIEKEDSEETDETEEKPTEAAMGIAAAKANCMVSLQQNRNMEPKERVVMPVLDKDSTAAASRDDVHVSDASNGSNVDGRETHATPITPQETAQSNEETASSPTTPPQEMAPSFSFGGLESLGASIGAGIGAGLESLGLMPATPAAEETPVEAARRSEETDSCASSARDACLDAPPESARDAAALVAHDKVTSSSAPSEDGTASRAPHGEERPKEAPKRVPAEMLGEAPTKRGEEPVPLRKEEAAIDVYEQAEETPAEKDPAIAVRELADELEWVTEGKATKKKSNVLGCCGISQCLNP